MLRCIPFNTDWGWTLCVMGYSEFSEYPTQDAPVYLGQYLTFETRPAICSDVSRLRVVHLKPLSRSLEENRNTQRVMCFALLNSARLLIFFLALHNNIFCWDALIFLFIRIWKTIGFVRYKVFIEMVIYVHKQICCQSKTSSLIQQSKTEEVPLQRKYKLN